MIKNRTQIIKYKHLNIAVAFILIFIFTGYPIQASIPVFLKIDSTAINLGFRAMVMVVSSIIIIHHFLSGKLIKDRKIIPFIIFWLLYFSRLFVDLELRNLSYEMARYTPFFIFAMAFGGCFVPALAISISLKRINLHFIYKWIYIGCIVANLCILLIIIEQYNLGMFQHIFSRRLVIHGQEGTEGTGSLINPITISFYGSFLFILSLLNFCFLKSFRKIGLQFNRLFVIFGLIIGIVNLLFGASRGPMLATILLTILIVWAFVSKSKKKNRILLVSVLILSIGLLSFAFLGPYLELSNISVFNRLGFFNNSNIVINKHPDIRFQFYSTAWNQFLNHPIIGDQIMVDKFRIYPHNFILEVLMSLGIVGIIIVGICFYRSIVNAKFFFNSNVILLFPFILIFLSYFLLSMTSFSIFTLPGLWVSLAFMMSIGKRYRLNEVLLSDYK